MEVIVAKFKLNIHPEGVIDIEAIVKTRDAVPFYAYSPLVDPLDVRDEVRRIALNIADARLTSRMAWNGARKPREEN
jgi:hypothetical protein